MRRVGARLTPAVVALFLVSGLLGPVVAPVSAQGGGGGPQMPDPKQMSGRPLPVGDLPVGTVTVRVVRGSMTNAVPNHPVELSGGPSSPEARTNEQGRAEFPGLRPGTTVSARTTVDGEQLESQQFMIPSAGGIRVVLVAGAGASSGSGAAPGEGAPSAAPTSAKGPAQRGAVSLGAQSRIVIEMGDEALNVFNLLEIVNSATAAVQPEAPLVFELPPRAVGGAALEGSGAPTSVAGTRVTVAGPFSPGSTLVQFGYSLPISGPTLSLEQKLPVPLAQFSMMAQKVGEMAVRSPQIAEHRDMPVQGQIFIVGKGPAVPAGGTIALAFSGLPHQPLWPRNVGLALAIAILAGGAWGSLRTRHHTAREIDRRRRLEARRDRLFSQLVEIEEQHRAGTLDEEHYGARRRQLVSALERLYAEIDDEAAA